MSAESLVDKEFVAALQHVLPKLEGDFVFHHYHTKKRQCKRSLIFQDDALDGFDEDDAAEDASNDTTDAVSTSAVGESAIEAVSGSEEVTKTTETTTETVSEKIIEEATEKSTEQASETNGTAANVVASSVASSETVAENASSESDSKPDPKPAAKPVSPETLERRGKHTYVSHMFVLSYEKTILFALEIYTFYDPTGVTLFVSKADTTGQSPHVNGQDVRVSIKDVTRAILGVLLRQCAGRRVRICLFARPEKQYLFPLSADYPKKHVLTGPQLIRWWVSCLNSLLGAYEGLPKATLRIPGAETRTVETFLPGSNWQLGDIFNYQEPDKMDSAKKADKPKTDATTDSAVPAVVPDSELAIFQLPRFPDDPKSRFLDFLAGEGRTTTCSIKTFWEEIQGRQEFNAGILVGIMGVDGTIKGEVTESEEPGSCLSYKEFKNVREIITESDYTTTELVIDANRELLEDGPSQSHVSFKGIVDSSAGLSSSVNDLKRPVVNTLNMNLVRKKKKTT